MKLTPTIYPNKTPNAKVLANADVVIEDSYVVHGLKVLATDKGPVVVMPSTPYEKDGEKKYREHFNPITKEARADLLKAVLDAYAQATA